ncbi:class I SAM-dependent methyltransferase [bacterium]|nr:class I SAM-dependent methyltransferase [bacterium]
MLQMRSFLLWLLVIASATTAPGYMITEPILVRRGRDTAPSGGYALDIGCGTGESTMDVLRNNPGMTLVGIDNDEGAIRHAKKRYGDRNPLFLCRDAGKPVFAPRVFDLVQMRFCLFSIRDENVIHEAWRVMDNDGRLVVIDHDAYAQQALLVLERRFESIDTYTQDGIFSTVYRKKLRKG